DCNDNCPNDVNPDQADSDNDGIGDACETDDESVTQCIEIIANRHYYISFNILPFDPSVESVFAPIEDVLAWVITHDGRRYNPGVENSIGFVVPGEGYRVWVKGDDVTLCVEGEPFVDVPTVTLPVNQRIFMGPVCSEPVPVTQVFADVIDNIWWVINSNNGTYWVPGRVNTIGNMEPGQAYKVYHTFGETTTFTYDCGSAAPASMPYWQETALHFTSFQTGSLHPIIINEAKLDNLTLQKGDEIGIYDGEICVGSVVVQGNFPLCSGAWQSCPKNNLPGFSEGNPISFRIWHDGQEFEIAAMFVEGDGQFSDSYYSVVSLSATTVTQFKLTQNYPNPFNPNTTIAFALPTAVGVKIKIYNVNGQLVKTLVDEVRPAGKYEVNWDGTDNHGRSVSSGLYFYS
ncbi:MAG: T9SS type A sorting domain-containing protein, partial [Planctomycetes bacterium]|nr:T9SS type A sorting domain-containing protein [Planctomycetota bacterium]